MNFNVKNIALYFATFLLAISVFEANAQIQKPQDLPEGDAMEDSLLDFVTKENPEPQSIAEKIEAETSSETEKAPERKSWMHNAFQSLKERSSSALSDDGALIQTRSNASVFDISGVMLRMTLSQVEDALLKRGYKKIKETADIPNFIRWRNEESCRAQKVVGFERLNTCVVMLAQKNNYQFTQSQIFNNYKTQETVTVLYTSNFTGNKAYRITYQSEAANIKGSGPKAEYLRKIKVFDFWKKINQKYGVPDNKEQVLWGLGDNKPYLKAATGFLVLHDPMLLELDYVRMEREDKKFMNTAVYTF